MAEGDGDRVIALAEQLLGTPLLPWQQQYVRAVFDGYPRRSPALDHLLLDDIERACTDDLAVLHEAHIRARYGG